MTDRQGRDRTKDGQYAQEVAPDDVLELFTDCEPRTAREIADELGITRSAVMTQLFRARQQLKAKLGPEDKDARANDLS
jgi:DNA-directed RNA polymerase specialized sigma24 family protein